MNFSKYSKKYIHYYDDNIPKMLEFLFNNNRVNKVADLGAGDGAALYALKNKGYLKNLEEVIAIDLSQDRINRIKDIDKNIFCIVGDASNLSKTYNSVLDLVISMQVIEHVPNEETFLDEICRALKPKGLLYLTTVFKKKYAWYFYRNNGKWVLDPTHLREYRERSQLIKIIEKCNFKVLKESRAIYKFPLTDFFFRRLGCKNDMYKNRFLNFLRKVKIPIFGYYNWELVLKKIS